MSTNEETITRTAFLKMPNRTETSELSSEAAVPETEFSSEQAFNDMYKAYGSLVHGILLARLPRDEVQDVLQEVFLSAFKNLNSLRDRNAAGGWLVRIARNHAADFYRNSRRTEELADDIPNRSDIQVEAVEVLNTIKTLPDAYCETLVLRLVEGMTGEEIARQTGRTPESVRVNLHRGMTMLRQKLGITEEK